MCQATVLDARATKINKLPFLPELLPSQAKESIISVNKCIQHKVQGWHKAPLRFT